MNIRTAVALLASIITFAVTGVTRADTFAYMGTNAGDFGTIDLDTGAFSLIGNSGQTPAGYALFNGQLYAVPYNGTTSLQTLDTATGQLTNIGGGAAVSYDDFGGTTAGLCRGD